MKNYVQDGDAVTVAAPYAVDSGAGALVGTLFGVASNDAENGATVVLVTRGVFDLAKVGSQAWTVGAAIYWDNTNKYCTTTTSGNTLIGKCLVAVGSGAGETTGRVRLNG
jgi:predicted RecA/RadA family phage recombinase